MPASLDWVAPRPRVRAGEKGRLEWRHVPDLSPHLQDLHSPPQGQQPRAGDKALELGRAQCQA